jgi:hypothetical protein
MRVRDWDDILQDVVESDADPAGWRAVGGDRRDGIGEDLYLAHPGVGTFQLKLREKPLPGRRCRRARGPKC